MPATSCLKSQDLKQPQSQEIGADRGVESEPKVVWNPRHLACAVLGWVPAWTLRRALGWALAASEG